MTSGFELVLYRFIGLLAVLPIGWRECLSWRLRAGAAFVLSVAVWSAPPVRRALAVSFPGGAPSLAVVVGEVALGAAIGVFVLAALVSLRGGCRWLARQIGFEGAAHVDPAADGRGSGLESLYSVVAIVLLVSIDLHITLVRAVVESFVTAPPGSVDVGRLPEALAGMASGVATDLFAAALTLALPATLALLLVTTFQGIVARLLPGKDLLFLGAPVRALAGLTLIALLMPSSVLFLRDVFRDAVHDGRWFVEMLTSRS